MRLTPWAIGPVLAGCALVAVTSCSTDEPQTEAGLAPNISPAVAAVSAYDIVKVGSTSINVDGNLSDWATIASISMSDDPGNGRGALNNSATVKLAWNDTYLYAAYNVSDTELLAAQTTRDHHDLYTDDAVELYVDPQGDGSGATRMTATDFQFLANVRETLGDNRGTGTASKDSTFNSTSFLAKAIANGTLNASGGDTGYTIEIKIAWTDLGVTPAAGNFMRLDLAVDDDDTANTTTEEFDWAGLTASYNDPSGWKDVQLVNPPPPVSAYDVVKVPGMTVDGNLNDWAGIASISMADHTDRAAGLDNTAKVKLAWDNTYLYAAYDVTDTELLAAQTVRDNGQIYQDDAIELYIDPQGDGSAATSMTATDYQVLSNIREALGDANGNGTGGKDAAFTAPSFLAKAVPNGTLNGTGADAGYTVELRIAWSDLGVTPAAGNYMRIDPAVDDDDTQNTTTEEFDWAGLTTTFNNPSGWKNVKLVTDAAAPAAPTNPALTVVSSSRIDVSWTASTSIDVAKYNIYRATSGTPTLYKTVSASPYQDTGLTPGTTYTYQISAVDAAGNESAKTSARSAATTGSAGAGRPFGPSHLPLDSLGRPSVSYTSAVHNGYAPDLRADLDQVRAAHSRIFLGLLRSHTKDAAGHLSVAATKAEFAAWDAAVDLEPYIQDGTILAIYLTDDISNGTNWGGETPPKPRIDSLALAAKDLWPSATTIVRARPDQLMGYTWRWLDAAWSQYSETRDGPVQAYSDKQVADAKSLHLGLVLALNVLDGGDGSSGIYGTYADTSVNRWQMSAAEVLKYGKVFLAEPYACAQMQWTWSPIYNSSSLPAWQLEGIRAYDTRSDVKQSNAQLRAIADTKPVVSCREH